MLCAGFSFAFPVQFLFVINDWSDFHFALHATELSDFEMKIFKMLKW